MEITPISHPPPTPIEFIKTKMAEQQTIQPHPIPQSLAHLILLNVEYGVLICIGNGCRCAVSPASISRHLRRKHHVRIELRKQVDRYIEGFPFQYDHSNIRLPQDGLGPQPIIKVVDGFQCQHCTIRPIKSQSRKAIKEHGNKEHGKKRVADKDLFIPVRLQSWFWEGKERYWVVDESQPASGSRARVRVTGATQGNQPSPDGSDDHSDGHSNNSDSQDEVDDQILRDIKASQAHLKEQRLVLLKKVPVVELDSWIRFTGWNEVLNQSEHNMRDTHRFTREPDPEELELTRLLVAWNRILERCLDTLVAMDHKDTLKWWVSPKNEAASVHPFELPQNAKTMTKYSSRFQGFVCYAMRTAPIEHWDDKTETGVRFTRPQWKSIKQMRTILMTPCPDDPTTEVEDQDQELTSELMGFCQLVVMQDMGKQKSVYDSPLMHYLAVMGVDTESNTFRVSFFYTPILAGILYINRLIMLEIAVSIDGWPELDIPAKDDIPSVPERIHQIRRQYLCEASFSPTSSILSQLAMGKSFNKLHQSPSNIHWSEDEQTIFYLGKPVHLFKITSMCEGLIGELAALIYEMAFHKPVPTVDLSKIVDSMAWSQDFRKDDYSFIKQAQNRVTMDVGFKFMLKRARKATGEWQMLRPGLDEQVEWIDNRAHGYLNVERKFLGLLMVYCHVSGGQPARGPELGSTKVSNSVYSARGWYVINGRLCFLTMYDKARKRRGNTEYIVRFLPDQISQIMVQYLVYIRPFARAVEYEVTKALPSPEYLFRDARGPWAGEELTRALGQATEKYLGVRLTTSGWRHVAIGIATRHLIRESKSWEKDAEGGEDNFAEGDDEEDLEEATYQHILIRYVTPTPINPKFRVRVNPTQ